MGRAPALQEAQYPSVVHHHPGMDRTCSDERHHRAAADILHGRQSQRRPTRLPDQRHRRHNRHPLRTACLQNQIQELTKAAVISRIGAV